MNLIALVVFAIVTLAAQLSYADSLIFPGNEVDVRLVLAVDNSGSVKDPLGKSQRRGFAAAFRDPALHRAIASGHLGRIAVTYFEWAGLREQRVIVPWTIVARQSDLTRIAEWLEVSPEVRGSGETSISDAIVFANKLLEGSGFESLRSIVDISGNGRNSQGLEIAVAKQTMLDAGTTINGLVLPEPSVEHVGPYDALFSRYDGPLIDYYLNEVIGGPGAFAIEVDLNRGFVSAILRKLVLEIAWVEVKGILQ